jgi:two-component sensor histidine kinase
MAALGLATALFVVIAAISTQSLWQGYHDALTRGEQRAYTAAQTVAAHFQWMIEASRQALRRLDDTVGFRPELLSISRLGDIDDAIEGLPDSVDVRIFDASGRELLSTRPEAGELEISDRDYFQALRDGEQFVISGMLVDRVTKEQSFVVARRLVRGGQFAGIAAIVVPTELIVMFWASLDLGTDSATSIIRDDGWLVTRYPRLSEALNVRDQVLFSVYLPESPSGSFLTKSRLDGTDRIVGYQRVNGAPLVAAAALSTEAALAEFRTRVRRLAVGLIPVVIGLFGFSWWVSRLLIADARQRASLEEALEQNRLLFREIHHRVKNNLQTVASLVRLQSLPQDAKRELANRIAAMAAVHEQIYRSEHMGDVNLDSYLESIIRDIELGFDRPVEVECELETIPISADRASVVGLIVTEVLSNSLKHGFPGDRSGQITVGLARTDEGAIRLEITDDGAGFDAESATEGLGLKLIRSFAQQLGGEYTLSGEGGLRFDLVFPDDENEDGQAK